MAARNPVGPSVSCTRLYRSARAQQGYASPGLSAGWVDEYDIRLHALAPGTWGALQLVYPNGATDTLTPVLVGGKPTGKLNVPAGASYWATGVPSGVSGRWQSMRLTAGDLSFSTFTPAASDADTYLLTRLTNALGRYVSVSYDAAHGNRLTGVAGACLRAVSLPNRSPVSWQRSAGRRGRTGGRVRPVSVRVGRPEGWMRIRCAVLTVLAVVVAGAAISSARGADVAVFREPGFPYYIASPEAGPDFAAQCLRSAGMPCDFVDAAALADPAAFNRRRYRVLVWAYGNTFPNEALANLRRFHAAKGSILALGGVPFCHPCVKEGGRWVDRIETLGCGQVSHAEIGTGLWDQATGGDALRHGAGDPLGIAWMRLPSAPRGVVQFVHSPRSSAGDPAGVLPAEDRVTPVVTLTRGGAPVGHPVCIVEHRCAQFAGATDIWAGTTLGPSLTLHQQRALLVASTAYLLERAGALPAARRSALLAGLRTATPAPNMETASYRPFVLRSKAPARDLLVLDVSAMTPEERMTGLAVQGLVNRAQPRIWLSGGYRDKRWLDVLKQDGYRTSECPSLEALVSRYRRDLKGAVVYDPKEPWTVNLATMESAILDAPMATAPIARRLRLRPVLDLRGRFRGSEAAFAWALENLWPKLDQSAAASMAPTWDAPRDYLIQHRLFTFWLDGKTTDPLPGTEGLLFEKLLARLPLHAGIYGWWQDGEDGGVGEWRGVAASSRFCKITVCTVGAMNLSVHSGMPLPGPLKQSRVAAGSLDRKVYLSFLVSDGDNFGENLSGVIAGHWRDPMRGRAPIGWGICPTQVELTPAAVRHWYRTASTNDLFLTMDGLGYVYPDIYGSAVGDAPARYAEFLRRSAVTMAQLDQRHLWFLSGTDRAEQMAQVLRPDGLFGEYGVPEKQDQRMLGATAALWADTNPWLKPWDTPEAYVKAILARAPDRRPAFMVVGVNGFAIGPTAIAQVLAALGPDYVAVRPDELCALYRRFRERGADAAPAPRKPLDLSLPPPAQVLRRSPDGSYAAREDGGEPDVLGWYTDPAGTQWVRKLLTFSRPAAATRAIIAAYVRGERVRTVVFDVNGRRHTVPLKGSAWQWVRCPVSADELKDGENAIAYTGNPEGRLYTAGDSGANLGHSEFGSPGSWSKLAGELLCRVELR